jgi:hypothetical protein
MNGNIFVTHFSRGHDKNVSLCIDDVQQCVLSTLTKAQSPSNGGRVQSYIANANHDDLMLLKTLLLQVYPMRDPTAQLCFL